MLLDDEEEEVFDQIVDFVINQVILSSKIIDFVQLHRDAVNVLSKHE